MTTVSEHRVSIASATGVVGRVVARRMRAVGVAVCAIGRVLEKLKALVTTDQLKRPLARPTNISLNDLGTLLAAHFGVDVSCRHVPSASVSNVVVQTLLPNARD